MYAQIAEVARAHGYAATVHGTAGRDLDVMCFPWIDLPRRPIFVVFAIAKRWDMKITGGPTEKPHGRVAYTLHIAWGDVYFDLQFMPAERYAEGPISAV